MKAKTTLRTIICYLFLLILAGCHEVPGVMTITFENRSDIDVYVRYKVSSLSQSGSGSGENGLAFVKKGKGYRITQWEEDYHGNERIKIAVILKHNYNELLKPNKLPADTVYSYTLRELEAMNFEIVYTGKKNG